MENENFYKLFEYSILEKDARMSCLIEEEKSILKSMFEVKLKQFLSMENL